MDIRNETKNGNETETKNSNKKYGTSSRRYIVAMNTLLSAMLLIVLFSLPQIIHAYGMSGNDGDAYLADMAEKVFRQYKDNSLSLFVEEEIEAAMEDYFDIFPEASYPDDLSFYGISGSFSAYSRMGNRVWNHAYELYRSGKIHGSSAGRWCTFFAQMWFYDIYGFNSSGNQATGDGKNFASTVYETAVYCDEEGNLKHYFEYGDKPMTMGIVSIRNYSLEEGHVLCVDEVDWFNNTITVSEGNARGTGDVRIRVTMTLDEFYAMNPGRKTYVNPTPELIAMLEEKNTAETANE